MDTWLARRSVAPSCHLEATAHHGPHRPRGGITLPGRWASHSAARGHTPSMQDWTCPGSGLLSQGSRCGPQVCSLEVPCLLCSVYSSSPSPALPGMPHCVPTAQSSAGHSSCGGPPPPGCHSSGAPVSWSPFICNLMGLKQDPLGHSRLLTSCLCGLSLEPLEVETLELLLEEKGSKAGRPGFPLWWCRGGALVLSRQCLLSSMSLLWCT